MTNHNLNKVRSTRLLTIVALFLAFGSPAPARAEITGTASVIDGDTIVIHEKRIRFHGIDAPESAQLCQRGNEAWRCGQKAALALDEAIASRPVSCIEKGTDRYGRTLGECTVGSVNLNSWMVTNGWALAYRTYSTDYVAQEAEAKKHSAGIWSGEFVAPWDYRKEAKAPPQISESLPTNNCQIKGNVSSRGERIYHVPGSRWYDATKIDESKGEHLFCSEADAEKAGWRKAKQR